MSNYLGYGQTSSSDNVGGHYPPISNPTGTNGARGLQQTIILFFMPANLIGSITPASNYNLPTFVKNVWILSRDYWDLSLSTPYSGQLYPVGGRNGPPGQIFPF